MLSESYCSFFFARVSQIESDPISGYWMTVDEIWRLINYEELMILNAVGNLGLGSPSARCRSTTKHLWEAISTDLSELITAPSYLLYFSIVCV